MTEKMYSARRRPAAVITGLATVALLGPLTACEGDDSTPAPTEAAQCTSGLAIHGMLPRRQDGKEQAIEITISKPRDPATFEGYVVGYELPKDESGDWHGSDLQQSDNKYKDGTYVVKLGKNAAALAVWTQSTGGGEDCDFKPRVDWGDAVPVDQINDDFPVVTWRMADTIG